MVVETLSGEKIKHSDCARVYIQQVGDMQWVLYIELKERAATIFEMDKIQVAIFDSVDHANKAKDSLDEAFKLGIEWNAKEFKKSLQKF